MTNNKKDKRVAAVGNRIEQHFSDQELEDLTADELTEVRLQKRMVANAKVQYNMLNTSWNTLWSALRAKYNLPAAVKLDEQSGQILSSKEAQ